MKIQIKICVGTTCFVMGGSSLQELKNTIPARYGDKVEVSACGCLDLCSLSGQYSRAPYVKINDDVIDEATPEKVISAIDKLLTAGAKA